MPFNFPNLVGYNTVFVKGGKMNLLTISWESVGKNGKADLKDVMETKDLTPFDVAAEATKDYIDTWDMENGNWGKTYYYVDAPEIDPSYADTWCNDSLEPVSVEMNPGSSFWLFHVGEDIEKLGFAGQVYNANMGYTLTQGKMNLCGNPFPTELNLNDKSQVVIANPTSFDVATESTKDYIDTWDLTTGNWGKTYYYVNAPEIDPSFADTWCNDSLEPVETTAIQAGAGFWYRAYGEGTTLTFTSPVK